MIILVQCRIPCCSKIKPIVGYGGKIDHANLRNSDYAKSIADCEKALRLNPCHFGAASGMGQCFMKQKKLRAALRVYRRANRINPNLDLVRETIESLERMLGEEGKK